MTDPIAGEILARLEHLRSGEMADTVAGMVEAWAGAMKARPEMKPALVKVLDGTLEIAERAREISAMLLGRGLVEVARDLESARTRRRRGADTPELMAAEAAIEKEMTAVEGAEQAVTSVCNRLVLVTGALRRIAEVKLPS